jgi:hypothetical protein
MHAQFSNTYALKSGLETEVLLVAPPQPRGAVPSRSSGDTQRRVALVVGNSNRVGTLRNPKNDARSMAVAFRRLRFEVDEGYDLEFSALQLAIRDFGDRAQDADWAVVYFAGHGIEYDQKPFIVPIDACLAKDVDINLEALPVFHILDKINGSRVVGLVIMDACRNNPFLDKMSRAATKSRNISVSPQSAMGRHARAETTCESKARHPLVQPRGGKCSSASSSHAAP